MPTRAGAAKSEGEDERHKGKDSKSLLRVGIPNTEYRILQHTPSPTPDSIQNRICYMVSVRETAGGMSLSPEWAVRKEVKLGWASCSESDWACWSPHSTEPPPPPTTTKGSRFSRVGTSTILTLLYGIIVVGCL